MIEVGANVTRLSGPDNQLRKGVVIQRDTVKSVTPGMIPYYLYQVRWEDGHVTIGHLATSLTEVKK